MGSAALSPATIVANLEICRDQLRASGQPVAAYLIQLAIDELRSDPRPELRSPRPTTAARRAE